jgi:hypothetical protein
MKKPQTGAGGAEAFSLVPIFKVTLKTYSRFVSPLPSFLEYQVSKFAGSSDRTLVAV